MKIIEAARIDNTQIDIKRIHRWILQITKGLIDLHTEKIIHRDIKPE